MEDRLARAWARINQFKIPESKKQEAIETFLNYEGLKADLVNAGYPDELDYPHTTAYINALKPLSDDFIEIVINWIPKLKFKGGALQYLREARNKYDGHVVIQIFNEADTQGKWFVCDTIAHNPPLHINDWVKETYLDKQNGYNETGLLPLAVAKMFPREEVREILKQGFEHHYRVTPEALGKVGRLQDIPFLENRLLVKYDAPHVMRDIEKAIKKIKQRGT